MNWSLLPWKAIHLQIVFLLRFVVLILKTFYFKQELDNYKYWEGFIDAFALIDSQMWKLFELLNNIASEFVLNLMYCVYCSRYWAIIFHCLIHHLLLIVYKESLMVSFSFYLFWNYLKNWKAHVKMLSGLSRKYFHLIRLDAQKFRQGSHTKNFRSNHKITTLLWSDKA